MEFIKEVKAGKIYVFQSRTAANSIYFEDIAMKKLFLKYSKYYLDKYLRIHAYSLNQDGWILIVKIKSSQTIRKNYTKVLQNRESEDSIDIQKVKIWHIISERIRLFLSTYVRMSNKYLGRKGVLVRQNYERIEFEDYEEAERYIHNIEEENKKLRQPKKKYRSKSIDNNQSNKMGRILDSSKWMTRGLSRDRIKEVLLKVFEEEMPIICEPLSLVALKKSIMEQCQISSNST